MRLEKYKIAFQESQSLPDTILALGKLNVNYSPRSSAIYFILTQARNDKCLTHGEFVELYDFIKEYNGKVKKKSK